MTPDVERVRPPRAEAPLPAGGTWAADLICHGGRRITASVQAGLPSYAGFVLATWNHTKR